MRRSASPQRSSSMRSHLRGLGVLALAVALAMFQGCSCGGGGGNDGGGDAGDDGGVVVPTCPAGLQSIALSPADSTVHVLGTNAGTVQFVATGTLSGGGTQDLTGAL